MSVEATDPWRDSSNDPTPGKLITMLESCLKALKDIKDNDVENPMASVAVMALILQMQLSQWLKDVTPMMDAIVRDAKNKEKGETSEPA